MLRKVGWVIFVVILIDVFIHMFGGPPPADHVTPSAPTSAVEHASSRGDWCSEKTTCDIWHAINDPDDGVPVQAGVPCRQQPTADSETRCILAKYPPPADTSDGRAWCDWQRTIFAQIDVPVDECSWNGKDY